MDERTIEERETEFAQMRAVLSRAELGCYLVIPLKYEAGGVKEGWIAAGTTQWRRS